MPRCFFAGCENGCADGSVKCAFHLHRRLCAVDGCRSQVYARGFCVKHGGKLQCQFEGCVLNSRIGTFCTKHGPPEHIRHCSEAGCSNQAHLGGRCFRHGGRRVCSAEDCTTLARMRGLCTKHMTQKEKLAQRTKNEGRESPKRPRDQRALAENHPPANSSPTSSSSSPPPVHHTAPSPPSAAPPQWHPRDLRLPLVKHEPLPPYTSPNAHPHHALPPLLAAHRHPPQIINLPALQPSTSWDVDRHTRPLPSLRKLPVFVSQHPLHRYDTPQPHIVHDLHRPSKSQALASVAHLLADYYRELAHKVAPN